MMPMPDESNIILVGCFVMLLGELLQTTTSPPVKYYSNEWIFELGEKEIPQAAETVAIVDCSLPTPNAHDLSDFWWAPLGCYSIPLSPATSPPHLILALYWQPEFCWLLSIKSIISSSISMIMMMWQKKHDLSGRDGCERFNCCAAARQLSTLGGVLAPILAGSHFSQHGFWPSNGQNPSWGRAPYGSILAIFGGCPVW